MDQRAIEGRADRTGLSPRSGRTPQQQQDGAETRVFAAIEAAFDVDRTALRATTRGRCEIAFARQTGMYLARVALGMTLLQAGHLFGRDRTTASHACRLIEDQRDDPHFDALLSAMESFVLRPEACDRSAFR